MLKNTLNNHKTTIDDFLNGTVKIEQPINSFRAGTDSVLLSAFNNINDNDTVVELGCGVGTVLICLLKRVNASVIGIEKEEEFVKLAKSNIKLNNITSAEIIKDDILNTLKYVKPNSIDCVITNPPYVKQEDNPPSQYKLKDVANRESSAKLEDFIKIAKKILKPKGNICLIHQSNRLDEILNILQNNNFGNIIIMPVYSVFGTNSTRVLISAKKNSKQPIILKTGLYLRDNDNNYSKISTEITRFGKKIEI